MPRVDQAYSTFPGLSRGVKEMFGPGQAIELARGMRMIFDRGKLYPKYVTREMGKN